MADAYDVIIIGSGGGYVPRSLAQLRLKTAIVERAFLGGICSNGAASDEGAAAFV